MDSNDLQINKIPFIISFGLSIKKLPWARDIAQLVWEVLCSIPVKQEEKEINLYFKDDKSENAQQYRDSSLAAKNMHIKHHK